MSSQNDWYGFLLQQLAAESYFERVNVSDSVQVTRALVAGGNREDTNLPPSSASRMASAQILEFLQRYQIIHQWSDDPRRTAPLAPGDPGYLELDGQQILANTGLSATLIKTIEPGTPYSNTYTLSIRSTENRPESAGGDKLRDLFGADVGGLVFHGLALAQIEALESYYAWLRHTGLLPEDATLNVTGYSLGGHLATVFTELHPEVSRTFTFNGAGRGDWDQQLGTLADVVSFYRAVLHDPAIASPYVLDPAVSNSRDFATLLSTATAYARTLEPFNDIAVYLDPRYLVAIEAVARKFGFESLLHLALDAPPSPGNPGPALPADVESRITQITGQADHNDIQGVSTSGIHAPLQNVFIEDQPDIEFASLQTTGISSFEWATTHSITLIGDSLALTRLLQQVDPSVTTESATRFLSAASNLTGTGITVLVAKADTNSLENVVEHLGAAFGVSLQPMRPFDGTGGFGDLGERNKFFENLAAIKARSDQLAADGGAPVRLVSLVDLSADTIRARAQQDDNEGLAYRFAVLDGSPFAVLGVDHQALHNAAGELSFWDPETRQGQLTPRLWGDRLAVHGWAMRANLLDTSVLLDPAFPQGAKLVDHRSGLSIQVAPDEFDPTILPPVVPTFQFGGNTPDAMVGDVFGDRLFGRAGTDLLDGGLDSNVLEGGAGMDVYTHKVYAGLLSNDENTDRILDSDAAGVILIERSGFLRRSSTMVVAGLMPRQADGTWRSADNRLHLELQGAGGDATLLVRVDGIFESPLLIEHFRNGDFGIHLEQARAAPPVRQTILGDRAPLDTDPGTAGVQIRFDAFGRPFTTDEPGAVADDLLFGLFGIESVPEGTPEALIAANAGERIQGLGGDDLILADPLSRFQLLAEALTEEVYDTERPRNDHDWITAGSGSDLVYAGGGDDRVEGGGPGIVGAVEDSDVIYGGDGDDELYADTRPASLAVAFEPGDPDAADLRGDFLSAGAGQDQIVGGAFADAVLGGGGDDLLLGGAGSDVMWGDAGFAAVNREWSVQRSGGNIDGVLSFEALLDGVELRDASAGGRDGLYGGSGSDWLFGETGDDALDGGADDDVLFGGGGLDLLIGGDGNDVLTGDRAEGTLPPDAGADYLDGGRGNDTVFGDAGDDVIVGGPGTDLLLGGAGRDIYLFQRGDGEDFIDDTAAGDGADGSVLILGPGFSADAIRFGRGSLLVELAAGDGDGPADRVHFLNFLPSSPREQPALAEIRFADGSRLSYEQILARGFDIDGTPGDDNGLGSAPPLVGTAVADRIRGFDGDDVIFADDGADLLDGGSGDDVIHGDAGDDTLIGGQGADALLGGAGNDRFVVDVDDRVIDDQGVNTYVFGDGVAPGDLVLRRESLGAQAAYVLYVADRALTSVGIDAVAALGSFVFAGGATVSGAALLAASPDESLSLIGTEADDRLTGRAAGDFVQGLAGNDTLDGAAGNDTIGGGVGDDVIAGGRGDDRLDGGSGADVYRFEAGDGHDEIVIEGLPSASAGVIRFGAGVTLAGTRLVRETGGALLVEYGASDTVRIPRFYRDAGGGIARIEWSDGTVVEQSALLAMPSPAIVGTTGPDTLTGGAFAERLLGDAGNDALSGLEGDDTVEGGAGADLLDGGPGNDSLIGGAGHDTYRLAVGSGADIVIDTTIDGVNTISLGAGLTPDDVSVVQSGDDLVVSLLGLGDSLRLQDAVADADQWVIAGSHGTASTAALRLAEQAATDPASMEAVRDAAWRAVHAVWASDLARRGLELGADDTWSRTRSPPVSVTLVRTNDAIQRGFEHLDGTIDGGTGIVPRPDDWAIERRTTAAPRTFHDTGAIERDVLVADSAEVVRARAGAEATQTATSRFVAMDWEVTWGGTRVTRSTTRSPYLAFEDGGGGSSNTGGPRQVLKGWFLTTDVHREATGIATGSIGEFVDAPPPVTSDSEPEVLLANIVSVDTRYRYTETLGNDAANRIEGGYFASGGAGDDSIRDVRVAYGDEGNDTLDGGEVLYGGNGNDVIRLSGVKLVAPFTHAHGGEGDDLLTGGDRLHGDAGNDTLGGAGLLEGGDGDDRLVDGATLVGGHGSDVLVGAVGGSEFRFGAGEPGIDQVFAPGVANAVVLDRFYRSRGFPLWEYHLSDPGRYILLTDASPVILDQPFEGATWLGPLPAAPTLPAANDAAGVAQLVAGGLLAADVVTFGPGIAPGQVSWSWSTRRLTDPFGTTDGVAALHAVLTARLAPDQAVEFILPRADSPLGSGVERFRFADGTAFGLAELLATLPDFDLDPTAGPLVLTGTAGPDTLAGRDDDDVVSGLAGNDSLEGGAGNDQLDGGTGVDQLAGGDGNDTYFIDDTRDLVVEHDGGGWDMVRSAAGLTLPGFVEGLELLPGATSGRGNALANHVAGSGGNDSLWGGVGSDIVQGGLGRDTLVDSGPIPTRIRLSATASGAPSTLVLGLLRIDGALVRSFLARPGRETVLSVDVNADPGLGHQIDILFAGSVGPGPLAERALVLNSFSLGGAAVPLSGTGTSFDPGLGSAATDGIGVGPGQGVLSVYGALRLAVAPTDRGNDLLDGGAGDDTLLAGAGNDLLAGGRGNDRLSLVSGADVIAFDRGDGTDSVVLATGATPTLSLGGGIGVDDIVLSRDRDALVVDTGVASDRVRFVNWYARGLSQRQVTLQLIDPDSIDTATGAATATQFDFDAAVDAFDAATGAALTASGWRAAHALLDQGSGDALEAAVIGGAPAMHYALQGSVGGLGFDAVQAALNAPGFGSTPQVAGAGTSGLAEQRRLF